MKLRTRRLVIKNLSKDDQEGMIALLKNDDIKKTYMIPDFNNQDEANAYFDKLLKISNEENHYLFGIYLDNQIIGMTNDVSINKGEIELGYFIDPVYWNNGYATEVLKVMIKKMFNLGFKKVIAGYFKENPASGRVMEKSGMIQSDKVDYISYRKKDHKCLYYEILNPKYVKKKKIGDIFITIGAILGALALTSLIVMTFQYFIPQGSVDIQKKSYDEGLELLGSGDYAEAAKRFKASSYSDAEPMYYVAKAGASFKDGDYESGIQNIADAGGVTSVKYDANGGSTSKNNEVLKKKKWIDNNPTRNGYEFIAWKVDGFKLNYSGKRYSADLKLVASWDIVTYHIYYNLNGGSLNNSVEEYDAETPTFSIGTPSKEGYTFTGWSGTDLDSITPSVSIGIGSTGNRSYTAYYTPNQYTITYNYGYDNLTDSQVVKYDASYTLITPTRYGYEFNGWYLSNGQRVSDAGIWHYATDLSLTARWTVLTYYLTIDNYQTTKGIVTGGGSYVIDSEVTVTAIPDTGYSFVGWYDVNGILVSADNPYTFKITSSLTLYAYWNDGNEYTLTLDSDGGDLTEDTMTVQFGSSYSLPKPTKTGYEFAGWYDGKKIVDDYGTWTYDMDMTFVAQWVLQYYKVTYELNGGTNNPKNLDSYTYFNDLILYDPTREGYQFDGWYINDVKVETIPGETAASYIPIVAHWSPLLNALTIETADPLTGTVSWISGSGYTDEEMVVMATPSSGYTFVGWHDGVTGVVSTEAIYHFNMPAHDYNLIAFFRETTDADFGAEPQFVENSDNIVTYGLYPTTHVNDSALINKLETLGSNSSVNDWVYYGGAYYTKEIADNQNISTFADGTPIEMGTTYWFKCEPIRWKMLSVEDFGNGVYSIVSMSEYIIDAGTFFDYSQSVLTYTQSRVRDWLNFEFLNTAFVFGRDYLDTTEVIMSNEPSRYDCVYLPSQGDLNTVRYGFEDANQQDSATRIATATDYAKIKHWESGFNTSTYFTRVISSTSAVSYVTETGRIWYEDTRVNYVRGIRPFICIKVDTNSMEG